MHFQLIIIGRNCTDYIKACLRSVLAQTHTDWKATVCLDAPTDDSYRKAKKFTKDNRIKVHKNKKRLGVSGNLVKTIELADPKDSDVIAIVDADDEIPSNALEIVKKEYVKNPQLVLTYGSFKRLDKKRKTKTSRRYKNNINIRKQDWHGSHLKTMKYSLYKHVDTSYYFKHSNGKWFQAASDLALMFPLFDLIGVGRYPTHTKHIRKITYRWNRTQDKTRGNLQYRNKKLIHKKTPAKRLDVI